MVKFIVYGQPRPQGSMRSFRHSKTGAIVTTSDNKGLKPWRQEIAQTALSLNVRRDIMVTNYSARYIWLSFFFKRPKSVSAKKRPNMTVKPDIDKLSRAVLDALKGVLYPDDSVIVSLKADKWYSDIERAEIWIDTVPII